MRINIDDKVWVRLLGDKLIVIQLHAHTSTCRVLAEKFQGYLNALTPLDAPAVRVLDFSTLLGRA